MYLFSSGLSIFFIKGKTVFINCPRSLSRSPPNCTILDSWDFDNLIWADELFAKSLQSIETSVLVDNTSCEKLVSSLESPIWFNETF